MLEEILTQLLKWIGYYVLFILFFSYIFRRFKDFGVIHSRWQQTFDTKFSSQEFYALVEEALTKRNIPNMDMRRVTKAETNFFLSQREYLEVTRADQRFLICAAPFADGFFVSWWFGKVIEFAEDFVFRIPNVGPKLAQAMFSKTYFQIDTDGMFAGAVKQAVNEAIDQLTNTNGIRPLTEAERMPQYVGNPYISKL